MNLVKYVFPIFVVVVFSTASDVQAVGYPHYLQNGLACSSCHDVFSTEPKLMPLWTSEQEPLNIDDTQTNKLCWSCHQELEGSAPYVVTHSSLQADESYGYWTVECRVCHEPHFQMQAKTYTNDYIAAGNSTAITATTITMAEAGWTDDAFVGMILIPNKNNIDYSYKIVGNTTDTITVDPGVPEGETETMNLTFASAGDPFAVSYGKLIRNELDRSRILEYGDWDPSGPDINSRSGLGTVKFIRPTGINSFADGDATLNGVCEVCHTQTHYHRNDGSVDQTHNPQTNCTQCHNHTNGFMHGSGTGSCVQCHGHDAGSEYDPDMAYPPTLSGGTSSLGAGSSWSHSTHTEYDDDDKIGPQIYCDTCHDTTNMPLFKNQDGSGGHTLAETDICDNCHSPGGTYNGVNNSGESIGAKDNWHSGVYEEGRVLQAGKEKWCAGCHDEEASNSWWDDSGVGAPDVIGDEDGAYTYGTGWGFYKTGHGLPADKTYPSKGGIETLSGRPVQCGSCHDLTTAHIDGVSRTFDCGPEGDRHNCYPEDYRTGYRLKLVDGEEPMIIPWSTQTPHVADASYFRLCAQCHVSEPFTDGSNTHTNFYTWRTLSGDALWTNRHAYHLSLWTFTKSWPADYLYTYDTDNKLTSGNSRPTCMTCHNVHGSTNLAMIRDGKLIDREPGQLIRYFDEDTTAVSAGGWFQWPPNPEDVTLADSIGTFWMGSSATNLCAHCHAWPSQFDKRCEPVDIVGDDPDLGVEPDCTSIVPPFQTTDLQTLSLEWTGENGYVSDGVEPNSGLAGDLFTFRIKVTSDYPELPWTVQLWIDKDDNGIYENVDGDPADEKIDLIELDPYDDDYTDGKIFTADVNLDKAGDNSFTYRFYAVGAWEDVVELPASPGPDPEVTINNNPPVLSWTGEQYFETDGVHPNVGGLDSSYAFRVLYSDAEGECPSSIQVWIDGGADKLTLNAGTGDCSTGKLYYSDPVTFPGGGDYSYRFYASDGFDEAISDAGPVADNTVTVQGTVGSPPQLEWVTESCVTDGVKPVLGLATGNFEFKVRYNDLDGEAPSFVKVWVDLNDNDTVEAGEEQNLTWVDDGDEDYTDGEVFSYTWTLGEVEVGVHKFVFSANGGGKDAVGEPTEADANRTVTVKSTTEGTDKFIGVRQGSGDTGPVWYNSLQDAIDPNGSLNYQTTILVYEGTYNENVVLDRTLNLPDIARDNNIILQSVCGPEMTTIHGRDDDSNDEPDGITVLFNGVYETNPVIDGFTITGGTEGIVFFQTNITVKNCIIEGNGRGIRSSNNIGVLTLEDSTIQNNVGTDGGAGIYLYGGYDIYGVIPQHTISRCVIKNNQSTGGVGGGIEIVNSGSDEGLTIEDTTISGNTAVSGGGVYLTYTKLDIDHSVLSANTSSGTGIWDGGGGLYMKESSSVTMVNSNVVDNSAYQFGAGIHLWGPNATGNLNMTNCTVSNNTMTDAESGNGGGVYNAGSNVSVHNSIVWNNRAGSGHEIFNGYGTTSVTWSDVLNNSEALYINNGSLTVDANSIEADPFFVDSGAGDYHLKSISPAIDQGTLTDAPDEDIDGEFRPVGEGYDMGADEYVDPNGYLSTYAFPATAVAVSNTAIDVSMPYTDDDNGSNTYTVEYKLSSSSTWLDWETNPKDHTESPYTDTITGLVGDETYDVRLTYNDADGVFGSPEQLFVVNLMPYVSFTSASQTAVDGGGDVTITAALDIPSDQDVTVPFSVNGSSTATGGGTDYSITPSPITITAGNTTADITVTIAADSILEADETVVVDMETPTNAEQGAIISHIVTIQDVAAYWQFDETSDVTASDSIGSNDATVMNGAVWTSSGKSGYALSFDGVDDYVEVPDSESLDITEELTIELWFQPAVTYDAALTDYVVLLDRSWAAGTDTYFLLINGDGKLHLGSKGGNIQSTQTSWEAGTWYHVVGTYRDVGGTYSGELYVNGVAETLSNDNYDNMAGGSRMLGIGGSDRFAKFNGIIDEVVIYKRAVTASEVLDRYNSF